MNVVTHRFTSAKLDDADLTQVQPSHWNDGHRFTGGAAGDVLTRDPTDASFGAVWKAGVSGAQIGGETIVNLPPDQWDYYVTFYTASDQVCYGAPVTAGAFRVGSRLRLVNVGPGTITLLHLSSAIGTGRLLNFTGGATSTRIKGAIGPTGGAAEYVWDGTYWRMVAHEQGGPSPIGLSNSNFVGFTSANIAMNDIYLHGHDAHIRVYLGPATIPAPVAALKIIGWGWTFAPASHLMPLIANFTPAHAGWGIDFVGVLPDQTGLSLSPQNFGTWPAGDTYLSFDITVPIL